MAQRPTSRPAGKTKRKPPSPPTRTAAKKRPAVKPRTTGKPATTKPALKTTTAKSPKVKTVKAVTARGKPAKTLAKASKAVAKASKTPQAPTKIKIKTVATRAAPARRPKVETPSLASKATAAVAKIGKAPPSRAPRGKKILETAQAAARAEPRAKPPAKAPAKPRAKLRAKKPAAPKPPPYLAAELGQPVDHQGEPIGAGAPRAQSDRELQEYSLQLWRQMQRGSVTKRYMRSIERAGLTIDDIWTAGIREIWPTSSTPDEMRRYRQKVLFKANLLEAILFETVADLRRLEGIEPTPVGPHGEASGTAPAAS